MEPNLNKVINIKISNTIENLKKNNMNAVFVPSKTEALALVKTLLKEGQSISLGGSVTLTQTGVEQYVKSGKFTVKSRNDKSYHDVDTFIMSSNAITENGCLYNVDGTGNRVSALIYGPEKVIILAGYNKIVSNLREAVLRVKNLTAPANSIRLDCDTYCEKYGHCIHENFDENNLMTLTAGACEKTICCTSVVSSKQRIKDRITVIIIGEELGY